MKKSALISAIFLSLMTAVFAADTAPSDREKGEAPALNYPYREGFQALVWGMSAEAAKKSLKGRRVKSKKTDKYIRRLRYKDDFAGMAYKTTLSFYKDRLYETHLHFILKFSETGENYVEQYRLLRELLLKAHGKPSHVFFGPCRELTAHGCNVSWETPETMIYLGIREGKKIHHIDIYYSCLKLGEVVDDYMEGQGHEGDEENEDGH